MIKKKPRLVGKYVRGHLMWTYPSGPKYLQPIEYYSPILLLELIEKLRI